MKILTEPLPQKIYQLHPVEFAEYIIGCYVKVKTCTGRIVEAEAYTNAPEDYASHAYTRENSAYEIMKTAGKVYIYSIHAGLALNITTDFETVGAVLIRAIEPRYGIELMMKRRSCRKTKISKTWEKDNPNTLRSLTNGPSKLAEALGIEKVWNNTSVGQYIQLYDKNEPPHISKSPRIGISSSQDLAWRFFDKKSNFVSK